MQQYKNALIIKHEIREGPGIIENILKKMNILYKIIELEKGEKLPEKIENIDFIFLLGGSMNVYQEKEYPFLKEEVKFIKKVNKIDIPFLGICLGAQILAKTFNGKVNLNICNEIGFFEVELTEKGEKDKIFKGIPKTFPCYQYHNDCFEVPKEGILLVKDREGKHQGFKIGKNLYGFQFHIEFDEKLIFDLTNQKNTEKINEVKKYGEKIIKNFLNLKKEGRNE
ncbi:MAG: type 1 glutamine amidotransferase [Candidatus Omnitrophica bacterium]|nr:type 1 glutamine amidotransferase [Candidatus Omnitrophota bacterium]MCM8802109.1 type 1 glutamine amidotransferase [Candidatus Omnitrophota bacterium]